MKINEDVLIAGTGCTQKTAAAWLPSIQSAMDRFGITSIDSIPCFLANVGVESRGLSVFFENLNYSAQTLANEWPHRYAVNPDIKPHVPNALANKLAHHPEAIANNVYANRLGNGDAASGDGWKLRGQGPIQLTGKDNILACQKGIGVDLMTDPTVLSTPEVGSLSAAWYFWSRGCIAAAEEQKYSHVVKLITGALPCEANQGNLRESRRKAAKAALQALPAQ